MTQVTGTLRTGAHRTPLLRIVASALLVSLLAACGTVTEAPSATSDELVETANGVAIPRELFDLFQDVNEVRSEGRQCGTSGWFEPAPPLSVNAELVAAAQRHATDQRIEGAMSHQGSDGSWPSDRVSESGYAWRSVGENVAWGFESADAVLDGWLASPSHCSTLMSDAYTEIGLAEDGLYWTQVFAKPM
jgi:uncharacterized protein YkwD